MQRCEATDLLTRVTRNSDQLVASIFDNANQIEELDKQISIRSMIEEIDRHKFELPRHIYNNFTVFHSNCLWESLKRKAADPENIEIYMFCTPDDPMHFVWKFSNQYFHFRRAFGKPRAEVFLKGYIEPYPTEKNIENFVRVDTFLY